ncbi:hypothetical protein [Kribbella deserti]|uniref:DUF222 domain-containing protein n=1 Tax=Kribbella deserti TaxID=1926257 RepID=A0ABV6QJX9_9ACTN
MGYDEFRAEYDQVMLACLTAKLSVEGLAEQVSRLTGLLTELHPADRNRAAVDVDNLQEILTNARQVPYVESPAFIEASRVFGMANADWGTAIERTHRARQGVQDIRTIAGQLSDPAERDAVLQLTEPLELLIDALEPGR